jgi:putative transposase
MPDHAELVICEQSIERTFAWISHNRRMAKEYERLCATGEAFVYAAMTRLMVRRLARA